MALFSISEDTAVGKTEVYCYCQIFTLSVYHVFTHRGDNEIVTWGLELRLITVNTLWIEDLLKESNSGRDSTNLIMWRSRRVRRHSAFVVAVRDPGVRPERYWSRGRPGALRSDVWKGLQRILQSGFQIGKCVFDSGAWQRGKLRLFLLFSFLNYVVRLKLSVNCCFIEPRWNLSPCEHYRRSQ